MKQPLKWLPGQNAPQRFLAYFITAFYLRQDRKWHGIRRVIIRGFLLKRLDRPFTNFNIDKQQMKIVRSKVGVPIRLTEERWQHVIKGHPELKSYQNKVLETVAQPDEIYQGAQGELLAVRKITEDKFLVVVYREIGREDGFIITAFLTSNKKKLERRSKIWP